MPRIKIKDLPKETTVGKKEMKKVFGGVLLNRTFAISSPDHTILNKIQEKMGVEPSPF